MADRTYYFKLANGALSARTQDASQPEPATPEGATALAAEEYLWAKAELDAEHEERKARIIAQDQLVNVLKYNSTTRMVAASTAPDHVKAVSAYVCDGDDDQVQINRALVDASADGDVDGGTVVLTAGVFALGDAVSVPPSVGLTLVGDGPATILDVQHDGYAVELADSAVVGAVLKSFAVTGQGGGIHAPEATGCDFSRLTLEGQDGYGIHASGADVRLTGCRFERPGKDAVRLTGTGHRVADNTFTGIGDGRLMPGGPTGVHLASASGCIVSGNTLTTSAEDSVADSLIRESGTSAGNLISGNVLTQNGAAVNGLLYQAVPGGSLVRGNVGVQDS